MNLFQKVYFGAKLFMKTSYKHYLLLFILSLFISVVSLQAQNKKNEISYNSSDCVYKKKFTADQRRSNYPFNVSDSIQVVSFRFHNENNPIGKDAVAYDSLIDQRKLTGKEIDQLTDIIYNNFFKYNNRLDNFSQCWMPRHAILFFDKNGKLLESIEICFHCERYLASSDKINLGYDCDDKLDKMRIFFKNLGIKFGLEEEDIGYPGETF